jgi:hypothetical protein
VFGQKIRFGFSVLYGGEKVRITNRAEGEIFKRPIAGERRIQIGFCINISSDSNSAS